MEWLRGKHGRRGDRAAASDQMHYGLAGLVGALTFVLSVVMLELLQPDTDRTRHYVSEFANGPAGWIFVLGAAAHALGNLALSAGFARALAPGILRSVSVRFLGIAAAGMLIAVAFPTDPAGGAETVSGVVHRVAAFTSFPIELIALFLLSAAFSANPAWRGLTKASYVSATVAGGMLAWLVVAVARNRAPGLAERFALAGFLAWELGASTALLCVRSHGPARKPWRPGPPTWPAAVLVVMVAAAPLRAYAAEAPVDAGDRETTITSLLREIRTRNPEIAAARQELEAARQRVAPAGGLEDPMLELGVANLPLDSLSFRREDMTMKMLGLAQRLPFPGKRKLREAMANADAESTAFGYEETVNRVLRDARLAYVELVLVHQMRDIVMRNRATLAQFLAVTEARYAAGQAAQADVLKAQTQLTGMTDELLRIDREEAAVQAELRRLLDRTDAPRPIVPVASGVVSQVLDPVALRGAATMDRPQLRGLQRMIDRSDREVALMQREYYPDFDVRLSYGQREPALGGMRREDMVSLTVAVNLPIWRRRRLEPQVAEARAMRDRGREMLRAQTAETLAALDTQLAIVEQSRRSRDLVDAGLLPQSRLTVESSLAAYRVGRVDFATLLDNRMVVYGYELERARASAAESKALAEIDFLVGKAAQ